MITKEEAQLGAKLQLARLFLWNYCKLTNPQFYKDDRAYLKDMCNKIQDFFDNSDKKFLIINLPPRHGKSFTSKNTVEWLFGRNPKLRVMTGSYNETLSGQFAKQVRDTIQATKVDETLVYTDIFPNTRLKYGESSASIWAIEGSNQKSYLATSPTGTATGFGAEVLIVDDVIKNDEEAYNEATKDKHWSWFNNTMLSRLEGDWKVLIIMTRWATDDLAGRIINTFGDLVELITYKAVQEDGSMLCEDILSRNDFDIKTQEMNEDIVEANYNQTPIDIKGRLYEDLKEWQHLPEYTKVYSLTDTADKGEDYCVTIPYIVNNGDVYILDIQYNDKPMEETELECTEMLIEHGVMEAEFESNNGGRGFARNIDRLLRERKYYKAVIKTYTQKANKEARILSSASWVCNHIFFPPNWQNKYKEAYKSLITFQKKGKNAHDDIEDVLAGIYERVANKPKISFGYNSII